MTCTGGFPQHFDPKLFSWSVIVTDEAVDPGDCCPADFNDDGEANTQDVLAFLNAWAANEGAADFNGEGGLGSIEPGREATLLLVAANPLEDITATRTIRSVVHRGEYLDRDALDALLAEAELAAAGGERDRDNAEPNDTGFDLLALDMPGRQIASGVYTLEFGGMEAGTESFRIHKTDTGYQIAVHNQPMDPGQVPFALVLETDARGVFARGTYTTLGSEPQTSRYRREGNTLIAEHGEERQEIELAENALIAGPAMASDFCTLQRLNLGVGHSQEHTSYSFGYPNWKWTAVANTVTRLEDDAGDSAEATDQAPADDQPGPRRVFRQVMDIPGFGRFEITSALDSLGVPVHGTTTMPFGTITATRGPLEQSRTTPDP